MPNEDKTGSATLEGREAAADAPDSKDNGKGTEGEKHDPADKLTPEHPRFQEIYGKLKTTERNYERLAKAVKEKEDDINLLRQHNQQLAESISVVHKTVNKAAEKPVPNPIEDPEGYAKYLEDKMQSDRKNLEMELTTKRHYDQVQDQKDLHEDYEEVVKPVMAEMEKDSSLKQKIWGSINPAREAYKYGKRKMDESSKEKNEADAKEKEREKTEREKAIAQGQVEGSSTPPTKNEKRKLTDQQKRVARALGVTEEKYLKQLEAMEVRS